MKKLKDSIIALFAMALLAVTVASCLSQTDAPPDLVVSAQADAPIGETTAEPTAEQETAAEPPYDPATHENGYCEGSCWEGVCPYFTGYDEPPFTYSDIEMMAKTVWGEARGCAPEEQRLVVWTVLQRVDAGGEFRNYNTITAVITRPNWFVGYDENNPIDAEIYTLCHNELVDWWRGAEPPTHEIYAPTAPYYFFDGDDVNNWFREEWR